MQARLRRRRSPTAAFGDPAEIAALGFPAYHHRPSAPTNLTLHQAIEINVPIGCGDAPVFPGDVILGDSDGVIVIPAHLADEIADEAIEMTAFEDFVTEQVRERPLDPRPLPRNRRADAQGFCGLAQGKRADNMPPAGTERVFSNSGVHIMLMFNNLIDGEWLSDGARAPNVNPSDTKDIVGEAVRGTRAQAEAAIAAAKAAFPAWSRSTPQVRYDILEEGIGRNPGAQG